MARETGARPNFSPGVAGDEVLEIAGEVGGRGDGSVYVLSTENGSPNFHALLVTFGVIHRRHKPEVINVKSSRSSCHSERKLLTASVKAADCSTFERCAASSSTSAAPRIWPARK